MTKLCARGKSAAKRKFRVYPSAYANAYASKICAGKAKDPSGVRRKDWGPKKAKVGMEVKIKGVVKGLKKASKLHAKQARTLMTINPEKKLVGGLLTKGIKYGYKQYRKAGGRNIIEIMKSGVRGAGKRSDAKTDVKYGIKMHGGSKLTNRDKSLLGR